MPVISSPQNKTLPFEGFKFPGIKLNKVVLPEPLGPIIPVMEPFLIFIEQFETAAKPPNIWKDYQLAKYLNCGP